MSIAQVGSQAVRTEADVAASVIAVLLDQQIISAKPEVLRLAADKVGVSVEYIRHEWDLLRERGYRKPHLRPVRESGILTPEPIAPLPKTSTGWQPRPRLFGRPPGPSPTGMKWCRTHFRFESKSEFLPRCRTPEGIVGASVSCAKGMMEMLEDFDWVDVATHPTYIAMKAWLEERVAAGEHVECPKCHRGVKVGEKTRLVVTLEHVSC